MSQSYDNYEYIIKDGQSSDGTMALVHCLTDNANHVMIVQGKDEGIYDAMNIAALSAHGEYIIFLNAGDIFADENVLYRASDFISCNSADIYYGNVVEVDKENSYLRIYTEKNCKMWYYSLGACLCHQGMFCKRELFQKRLFNLAYKVCADREWQMYQIKTGAVAIAMKFTVAEVMMDGFSKEHVFDLERETGRCVKQYCGLWYILYRVIMLVKKNKFLSGMLHKAEKLISCR